MFEDELCFAFRDIHPAAPLHLLVVPRKEIRSLAHLESGDDRIIGHCLMVAGRLADQSGFKESGYRVVVNTGADAGQTVFHLHFHVLAGRSLNWPPG